MTMPAIYNLYNARAKRRKTESLDGEIGRVCVWVRVSCALLYYALWVYLCFIDHFIVTKPSLRRSNLIQFDSFHACTTRIDWLSFTKANNDDGAMESNCTHTRMYSDGTAKANMSTEAKQINRKMKRWAPNYFTHTCDSQQSTWIFVWCACVCVSMSIVDCRHNGNDLFARWHSVLSQCACVCEKRTHTHAVSFNTIRIWWAVSPHTN